MPEVSQGVGLSAEGFLVRRLQIVLNHSLTPGGEAVGKKSLHFEVSAQKDLFRFQ